MCDQGLQLQVGIKQEQMEPRAQSSCFHANVWDNKSQGWGVGVGLEENTDRNRVGGAKGRCHVSSISSDSKSCY